MYLISLKFVHCTNIYNIIFYESNVLLYVGVSEVNARGKTYNLILAHMEYMEHVQENGERRTFV